MVKRLFRYLAGVLSYELVYKGDIDDLRGISDVSLADCRSSLTTCGYAIQLFAEIITWKTLKESRVALSTYQAQAEYVAMSKTCQELIALNRSLGVILNKDVSQNSRLIRVRISQ